MSDYVSDQRIRVGENLQYIKGRAIDHSGRQGFIAEMLSYAYLSRLAFSLSIFAIASYLNTLAAVIAGWRTPNVVILDFAKQSTDVKTLPDLGHDLFKFVMTKFYGQTTYIEWFDLPDEFLAAVGTLTSFIMVLHPRRLLIIRRFCFIFAIINLMRACCVAVTSLPDASPLCISQFDTERGNYKPLPIFPKCVHYCVRSELNTPFTRRFPYVLWMIRYYNYILSACGIFAIVGTRLHYTLDVLIAIYITAQVWLTYHWLMSYPENGFALIKWLEHAEVHLVDHNAYQKARRVGSQSVDKTD
ncbi:hypothetical protein DD238_002627 [Peronospora effusa]|uniref:Sphingomyelin synthase-like domain-containing protein n=1 Tax=Peronospora effusa TaxID=542832 RepID=A0A3M6VW78_9STRA|nr:hypothetical protein DD238_002627 [Peronospora effusa]RQM16676.1 hypothetical protein DD237_003743 [Peronospora effusa]